MCVHEIENGREEGGMCGQAEAVVLYHQSVLEGTSDRKKKTER